MAALPLESLPLGFRFRPTDEELMSHYLKRKITGDIQSEREVIPEIDVCKCEPWDLPDKSLIRSDDPEWFFFAPKDRKYPNGSRSNRATEKGYWKATGKDRIIKSKGPTRQQHMIGMKKTLVFHKGRAPRGERTQWIMHEYRATEPEFSGDHGGYVLYKLFRKTEEKFLDQEPSPSNLDEVDRSGHSPAPSRSSPDADNTPHEADNIEEVTAAPPIGPNSNIFPHATQNQAYPVQDLRTQFFNPSNNINNNNNNNNNDIKQANQFLNLDDSEAIQELLDLVLPNQPDESHSPNELYELSDFSNIKDENFGTLWDGVNLDDILNDMIEEPEENGINNLNSSIFENAPPLPYDCNDPDVVSFDSGTNSFQDLFNTWGEETSVQNSNYLLQSNNSTGIMIRPRQQVTSVYNNDDTGINIRMRGGANFANNINDNNYYSDRHGVAPRRLCLQTKLKIGSVSCSPCQEEESSEVNSEADSAESIVVDKLEELSVYDDDNDEDGSPKHLEEKNENEDISVPRLRKKIINENNKGEVETLILPEKVSKKGLSIKYRICFSIIAMIICVVILWSVNNNNISKYNVSHV